MIVDELWLDEGEPERYLTMDEWEKILKRCTYVYVAATNDEFEDMYGELFEDEVIDGHIYKVYCENDEVVLRSIDS